MSHPKVAPAPDEFDPVVDTIGHETRLYRVHQRRFAPEQMNPGTDPTTQAARVGDIFPTGRFSFFLDDDPEPRPVPVLYAAATENAAIWETILRDREPSDKSPITPDRYLGKMIACIRPNRRLHVASLAGADMSRFGLPQNELTGPGPLRYAETIPWARAAWASGFDGIKYVSHRDQASVAYVFFESSHRDMKFAHAPDAGPDRDFEDYGDGLEWLSETVSRWRLTIAL